MVLRFKVNNDQIISGIALFILFVSFQEEIVLSRIPDQNRFCTILLAFLGVILFLVSKRVITKNFCFCFAIALIALLYSYDYSESMRYFLLLISILTWREVTLYGIEMLVKILIIEGMVLSIYQWIQGSIRVSGFMSSPPQFACLLLVCLSYLLILNFNKKKQFPVDLYCMICLIMIYMSETRVNIIASLGITVFYIFLNLIEQNRITKKRLSF